MSKVTLAVFALLTVTSIANAGGYRKGSFPKMASWRLNNILESALKRIDCSVGYADGVGHTSKEHDKANPSSCHKVGMAIDIHNLDCSDGSGKKAALQKLYRTLPGRGAATVVCYNHQGPCPDGHTGHLHFGAIQAWPFRCKL